MNARQKAKKYKRMYEALEALDNVPPAILQPKVGHWIGEKDVTVYVNSEGNLTDFIACKCSECGEWLTGSDEYVCGGRYCPNCGAKMEEVKHG